MGELAQAETKIPIRETAVAVVIAHGGRSASRPHTLMVYQNYLNNPPELLRPVQGGVEDCDTSLAATAIREVGEETGVWLDRFGSPPMEPLDMPRYEGVPRDHHQRGLQIPRYVPFLACLEVDQLPCTTPRREEYIGSAGWFPLDEAYARAQLINRETTRQIISEILLRAFDAAEHSLQPARS